MYFDVSKYNQNRLVPQQLPKAKSSEYKPISISAFLRSWGEITLCGVKSIPHRVQKTIVSTCALRSPILHFHSRYYLSRDSLGVFNPIQSSPNNYIPGNWSICHLNPIPSHTNQFLYIHPTGDKALMLRIKRFPHISCGVLYFHIVQTTE